MTEPTAPARDERGIPRPFLWGALWGLGGVALGLVEGALFVATSRALFAAQDVLSMAAGYGAAGVVVGAAVGLLFAGARLRWRGGVAQDARWCGALFAATLAAAAVAALAPEMASLPAPLRRAGGPLAAAALGAGLTAALLARLLLGRGPRERPVGSFVSLTLAFSALLAGGRLLNQRVLTGALLSPKGLLLNAGLLAAAVLLFRGLGRTLRWRPTWGLLPLLLVVAPVAGRLLSGGASGGATNDRRRPNIVLIVLDTVRRDRLGCYGGKEGLTPNLDALAAEGIVFDQAISTAPWTVPAHASLFTGTFPSGHGAEWGHLLLEEQNRTLAEVLRDGGYRTAAVVANPMLNAQFGFSQGFEVYWPAWSSREVPLPILLTAGLRGEEWLRGRDQGGRRAAALAGRWIKRGAPAGSPFFLFLNLLEAHLPYNPPQPYRERWAGRGPLVETLSRAGLPFLAPVILGTRQMGAEELQTLSALYDGEVAYVDHLVGELLAALRERGLLDSTVVVALSDHGENLGEHRLFDHQLCLYDTLLRIPLLVRAPGLLGPPRREAGLVQTSDVFWTLVQLAGAQRHVGHPARPLTPGLLMPYPRPWGLAEYRAPRERLARWKAQFPEMDIGAFDRDLTMIRGPAVKYISSSDGRDELYDLSADPPERRDLLSTRPEEGAALRALLARLLASFPHAATRQETPALDKETWERIRSLGYVD